MKFLGREVEQNSGELAGWSESSRGDIHVRTYVCSVTCIHAFPVYTE